MAIYPNPATDYLYIQITPGSNNGQLTIELIDMAGKQILSDNNCTIADGKSLTYKIATSQVKEGMYFVKITSARRTTIDKIVIMK
ncbi:MAG: T9SS type A sorting domain-containing protein [Bacteroidota bacterium]